jgi:hypothetical protein
VKGFKIHLRQLIPGLLGLCLYQPLSFAETGVVLNDAEAEAAKARKNYTERFIKFTQDKNVMGKAKNPQGKVVQGGQKTKFNADDGLSYQSDLTYHDFSYNTPDSEAQKANPNDPNAQSRTLYGFISSHGGIAEGGGSSLLERVAYEKHTEYSKKDEDPKEREKRDQEKGIKYRSIFKVETREVFKKPDTSSQGNSSQSSQQAANNKPKQEPDKVERTELRPDVKQAFEEVGETASKTVERAAKDPGSEDDPNKMGNLSFYYEAASRASRALWDSTLSNLSQRRVNRAVEKKNYGKLGDLAPTLSESTPTCESWAQSVTEEIGKLQDAKEKQSYQEQLSEQVQQCQQMVQVKWSAVDPRFENPESQQKQQKQIKEQGTDREDDKARDLRNQLQVMDKVGISSDELQTNWKYGDEEFQNEVVEGDGEGNSSVSQMSNSDQLNAYNQAIDSALESLKETKQLLPDYQVNEQAIQTKKIEIGKTNLLEINKLPEHMQEGTGSPQNNPPAAAQTYQELVQQQQAQN